MGSGASSVGKEPASVALDDALHDPIAEGLKGIFWDLVDVGELQLEGPQSLEALALELHVPVEEGHGLGAGDDVIRTERGLAGPVGDPVLVRPEDRLAVVGPGGDIFEGTFADPRLRTARRPPIEMNTRAVGRAEI